MVRRSDQSAIEKVTLEQREMWQKGWSKPWSICRKAGEALRWMKARGVEGPRGARCGQLALPGSLWAATGTEEGETGGGGQVDAGQGTCRPRRCF